MKTTPGTCQEKSMERSSLLSDEEVGTEFARTSKTVGKKKKQNVKICEVM